MSTPQPPGTGRPGPAVPAPKAPVSEPQPNGGGPETGRSAAVTPPPPAPAVNRPIAPNPGPPATATPASQSAPAHPDAGSAAAAPRPTTSNSPAGPAQNAPAPEAVGSSSGSPSTAGTTPKSTGGTVPPPAAGPATGTKATMPGGSPSPSATPGSGASDPVRPPSPSVPVSRPETPAAAGSVVEKSSAPKNGVEKGSAPVPGEDTPTATPAPVIGKNPSAAAQRSGGSTGPGPGTTPTAPWQRAGQGPGGSGTPSEAPVSRPVPAAVGKPAAAAAPTRTADKAATSAPAPAVGAAGRPPAAGARAAQKQVAQAKAAVIDGPTRHIAREDLAKDLPDLSEIKHPTPGETASVGASARRAPAVVVAATTPVGDPLRASVQVRKIDPWSTLKVAAALSVAMFFVWMFAVGFLYIVLDGMGVWDRLNNAFTDIVSESSSSGLVTAGQVFGYSALIGGVNVVLFTALATVGAFIYNLCTDLVGGVEVTLADRD